MTLGYVLRHWGVEGHVQTTRALWGLGVCLDLQPWEWFFQRPKGGCVGVLDLQFGPWNYSLCAYINPDIAESEGSL